MLRRFPGVVLELRTARASGVAHSVIRHRRKPTARWTDKDARLMLALTAYEDGLCPSCGHPRDRAWNEDMEGWYVAHRATCQACQAVHLEKDRRPLTPAETVYVTDDTDPGFEPDPRQAHRG